MTNRLSGELSPYLQQHAANPVAWKPWDEAALQKAKREDKPIFLSIGYSACHWCHVMAHESFTDEGIADFLNEHFVNIKVDREERPDLDQIYMESVHLMCGRGGWPMSVFLTPDLEPFYGGTYWPPAPRQGMPGFGQVLRAVAEAWQSRRPEMVEQAAKIARILRQNEAVEAHAAVEPLDRLLEAAEESLMRSFDPQFGGFGPAPKFPQPIALKLLLNRWQHSGDENLLHAVTLTLDRMARGGLYDQLGGGFHRYSTDARWLVPHFEKMLYDNALLAGCYLDAWAATKLPLYAQAVRGTLDYLLRDMTDPEGGFYSAEDADSEGEEGKFYVWTPGEIAAVLGETAAAAFCRVYDVTDVGNFEGCNILNLSRPIEQDAKLLGRDPGQLETELAQSRAKLLVVREMRIPPGLDDKILVNWNGLAIDAFARAGAVLREPRYRGAAELAANYLWKHLRREDGRLLHCARRGRAKGNAFLDDYANLGNALLTLHETGGEGTWLDRAVELAEIVLNHFADAKRGGFFFTADDHEPLLVRKKEFVDSPTPSGNGMAAMLLLRLHRLRPEARYRAAAESALCAGYSSLRQYPAAACQMLLALELLLSLPGGAAK
ncbi:MAG: thioredoxin domain-containing protein [Pirellulales bacterium]|nr:thioredoxin domain-containing protein [Pirellulales bacterium]